MVDPFYWYELELDRDYEAYTPGYNSYEEMIKKKVKMGKTLKEITDSQLEVCRKKIGEIKMPNVYEKLQNIRCELQGMKLKKSGENKFAGFDYYELTDFLPQVNSLFNKNKLFSNFSIAGDYANLTIINSEAIDEKVVFTSPVESLDLKGCNKIQALGGVHTYMKRYLYMNALEIVENDMFDPQEPENAGQKKKKAGTPKIEEPEEIDPDLDILNGLMATDTAENALLYYRKYKDKVKDEERFRTEYAKLYRKRSAQEAK